MSCRNYSCVCCNLQTAGVVIGGFGSFLSLYHGIQTLVVMKEFMKNNQEMKLDYPIVSKFLEINQCSETYLDFKTLARNFKLYYFRCFIYFWSSSFILMCKLCCVYNFAIWYHKGMI